MTNQTIEQRQIAVYIDFENLAVWADDEKVELHPTAIMEYLTSRGTVIIRRAYGDFSRFSRYRSELMDNSIELMQIFSFRSGKNLADIRMVVDAMEMVRSRPHINVFIIMSGDSDFTPLIARLREYGKYTIGIGPRKITHPLLVKGCDEFVYLETILGKVATADDEKTALMDKVAARVLLRKALQAHGQRGDLPVYASKLKQTMLSMNPAFNEANFGYSQFKNWLEDNSDLVRLLFKDMQLYTAPLDYEVAGDFSNPTPEEIEPETAPPTKSVAPPPAPLAAPVIPKETTDKYHQIFSRLKMLTTRPTVRRQVLRDIYTQLSEHPGELTTDQLLDKLVASYEISLDLTKANLRNIWQMAFRQRSFDYKGSTVSVHVPVWLQPDIHSADDLIRRSESSFIYAVLFDRSELDLPLLAKYITQDPKQTGYVQELIQELVDRGIIVVHGDWYTLSSGEPNPLLKEAPLALVWKDVFRSSLPKENTLNQEAVKAAMQEAKALQQKNDFSGAAEKYLLIIRSLMHVMDEQGQEEKLGELKHYLALFSAAQAGHYFKNVGNYPLAREYYLAFFFLVQKDSSLWNPLNRLIDPLLNYYWTSGIRELGLDLNSLNIKNSDPIDIGIKAAQHPDPRVRKTWQLLTKQLAGVNKEIVNHIIQGIQKRMAPPS